MLFVGTEPFRTDILDEHYDELGFLLLQRDGQIHSPELTLTVLRDKDERIAAHLDGLCLAGEAVLPLVFSGLESEDRADAAASAAVLLGLKWAGASDAIRRALRDGMEEVLSGLRLGLRYGDARALVDGLREIADTADPSARVVATDVLAFHRLPPPTKLGGLLDLCPAVWRGELYQAVGRLGGPWSAGRLTNAMAELSESEPDARRAALEASARLGLSSLGEICRSLARGESPGAVEALAFLGVVGDQRDLPFLQGALANPDKAPAALRAMGALGQVAAIPILIDAMGDPDVTRVAGRAFERITGATNLEGDEPLPEPIDLTEEESFWFEPVVPYDPDKALTFWNRNKERFGGDRRWQAGCAVPPRWDSALLDRLPLDARRDVYLGWRAADPIRTPDFELEQRTV